MLVDLEKIEKAKEKLGDGNADIIAEILQLENYDERNKKACCPWHDEKTPSFIYNPKTYKMHCFGCNKNTDILDAYMHTGSTYMQAVQQLFDLVGIKHAFGEIGVKTKAQYRYPKEEPLNDKENVYAYLAMRKISKETVDALDVREDEKGNIVFNFYDSNDVLCLVKYRPSHKIDKAKGEIKSWCQKDADTMPLLYNMNRINIKEPLLICEGEIDCMAAVEAGYSNAVSVPLGAGNFGWIEENWDWLDQFESIIICSDNDEPGVKMRKECVSRLGSWRTKYIEIPSEYLDENTSTVFDMKDLNHVLYYCGKQAVLDLIYNAKDPGVPSVYDLSDVQEADLDEIDGLVTGISELDSKLMKLFYGTLTIISGQPGAGKTSFLSQVMCQALEQEKNVWVFSRELPSWMTKSWLNYILAGRHHVNEYEDRNGAKFYKVSPIAKAQISEHYKGRWFVYRDDASNKLDDILDSMRDSVRKYGTKLLIVDNLMTLDLGANENNEMLKQTEVINKLIYFAMQYSVAVILVAHPRKLPRDVDVGIYDISGTANIANLAHRTIGLKRIDHGNPLEESNRDVRLTIIKDRMRGCAGDKVELYYDKPTRRFYGNEVEFGYQYSWDHDKHAPLKYPHDEEDEIYGARLERA